MDQTPCQTCGELFTPRRSGGKPQVRCSTKCRRKVANANFIKNHAPVKSSACAECGKPVAQSDRGRPRRFCSDQCKARAGNRAQNRRRQAVQAPTERSCQYCGKTFQPKRSDSQYCYDNWCAQRAYYDRKAAGEPARMVEHEVECGNCGTTFTAKHPRARWCSKTCQIRHRARDASRRRGPARLGDVPYTDREIFVRDKWRCHLCGKKVDQAISRRSPEGASIDHLIPLSLGGADAPANVATAHNRCNREKGVRARDEQLRLI